MAFILSGTLTAGFTTTGLVDTPIPTAGGLWNTFCKVSMGALLMGILGLRLLR